MEENTSGSSWYRDVFLKSQQWRTVRQKVIKRDGCKCWVCGATEKLEVHHLDYGSGINDKLNERNLITLCDRCHRDVHRFNDALFARLAERDVSESLDTINDAFNDVLEDFIWERNEATWKSGKLGWADYSHDAHYSDSGRLDLPVRRYLELLLHGDPKITRKPSEVYERLWNIRSLLRSNARLKQVGVLHVNGMRMYAQGRYCDSKINGFSPERWESRKHEWEVNQSSEAQSSDFHQLIKYDGRIFDDELSARWAVFFSACGVEWEYKPKHFDVGNDMIFTPDFLLHGVAGRASGDLWVSVRTSVSVEDDMKIDKFVNFIEDGCGYTISNRLYIVADIPSGSEMYDIDDQISYIAFKEYENSSQLPFNFRTIDGDYYPAHPGINLDGGFELFGDDNNYLCDRNADKTFTAFLIAKGVDLTHGKVITEKNIRAMMKRASNGS